MKMLILAVILAVMQAAPPIPRQTADNSAGTGANVKSESAPDQAKSLPTPVALKTNSNGTSKTDSGDKHPEDAEHTVGISKLPPVSVTKDWADWGVWVFSGLLVAVSFLQVWLLWRTLGAIKRQADIQEIAFLQWINIDNWKVGDDTTPNDQARRLRVSVDISNPTGFPLTIVEGGIRVERGQGKPSPSWGVGNLFLAPGITLTAVVYPYIMDMEYRCFNGGTTILQVRGKFVFRDVLGREKTQSIEGDILCSVNETIFRPSVLMAPKENQA